MLRTIYNSKKTSFLSDHIGYMSFHFKMFSGGQKYQKPIVVMTTIFLTAILLPHGQLWAIIDGIASLT